MFQKHFGHVVCQESAVSSALRVAETPALGLSEPQGPEGSDRQEERKRQLGRPGARDTGSGRAAPGG